MCPPRRFHRGLRAPLTALLLLLLAPASAAAANGWHGEPLPEGLARAAAEGEYVWKKDGAIMVYVPPGAFPMGSAEGARDEQPVHRVVLDGYYIDKHEVSWGQWKKTGFPYDEDPDSRRSRPRAPDWGIVDDMPVVNVTWREARDYAAWAGKELPSEAQWEKAARGRDGRTYPWGSTPPNPDRALWKGHPLALTSTGTVDCCAEGASPYGVLNLAGNVYEWVRDYYDAGYYGRSPTRNPVNDTETPYRVLRGGAFVLEVEDLRSALRYRLYEVDRTPYIGFRTVVPGVK